MGTNLRSVRSLIIGIEGAGTSGVIYIDDIRLYPAGVPDPLVAQDPGPDNLVAYYPLDNDTTDASGQENHGTATGNPAYATGIVGMATDASVNAAIGNQPPGAGDKHWDGLIDEVRIYDRGLSEAELLHIASGQ